MGAVTPETCRVVLQWINICILLHLLDFYSHWIMMHGTTSLKLIIIFPDKYIRIYEHLLRLIFFEIKSRHTLPFFSDCTLRRRKGWKGVGHVWPASQAMSFVSYTPGFIFTWNELIKFIWYLNKCSLKGSRWFRIYNFCKP